MILSRYCRSRSPLTRVMSPEMTCRALSFPPPRSGTVLMHFDASNPLNFNEHPKMWNLPDGAAALLTRSADWSAHNLAFGFVPSESLARFCSDPVQAAKELCRRGLWRQVKGGYQFTDWGLFGKTAGQAAQESAEADAERAVKSEGGKLGNHERWHVQKGKFAPGCEFCEAAAGPDGETDIAGAIGVRSVPTPIDRSDQSQSARAKSKSRSKSKSKSDADDPELVAAVASAICAEVGFLPGDDQARSVIRIFEERARKAGTVIRNAVAYYTTSVRKEPDLWKGVLLPEAPPVTDPVPLWPSPGHPPPPHPFRSLNGLVCTVCDHTRNDPRHIPEMTEKPA